MGRPYFIFRPKIKKPLALLVSLTFMFTFVLFTPLTALGYSAFTPTFQSSFGATGSGNGQFNTNWGVAVDSIGNIYVADIVNDSIQEFDSSGNFLRKFVEPTWSSYPGYTAATYPFSPHGVAVDSQGFVYATDSNGRVYKFDQNGQFIKYWEGLSDPMGIAIDSADKIYVVDSHVGHSVKKYDTDGNLLKKWDVIGNPTWSPPGDPVMIAVDSVGFVYLTERETNSIQKYTSDGVLVTSWGTSEQLYNPIGIAVDPAGYVYVSDDNGTHHCIFKYSPTGNLITTFGDSLQINTIRGIAVDSVGNLYASDMGSRTILKYDVGIFKPTTASFNVNSGAAVTTTPAVNLNISASATPGVTEMLVSNEPNFSGATWEPYSSTKSWTLTSGDGVKKVYLKFFNGTKESAIYQTSIKLDAEPPTGTVKINGGATGTNSTAVTVNIDATDLGTSVAQMMISNDSNFNGASWESFNPAKAWTLLAGDGNKTVYVKLQDESGNISQVYSAIINLDNTAPTGSFKIDFGLGETDVSFVRLDITANDTSTGSGVSKMMISNDSNFTNSNWQVYSTPIIWHLTSGLGSKTVYLKLKDNAGNISPTYTATTNVISAPAPTPTPTPEQEPITPPIPPTDQQRFYIIVQSGASGETVNSIQSKLISLGFDPGTVDGLYGSKTRDAIIKAQAALGLVPDGIVGPLTYGKLYGFNVGEYSQPLCYGSSKTYFVGGVQDKLIALGFNSGRIDGLFGPRTQAAIIAFQKSRGLAADGIIGPVTWAALFG